MAKLQMSLKARALKYLSAREHSRLELARKLARYAQEGDDVEALLDALQAANFLSEERFSESLVRRRAARFGNARILSELQSHGVDADAVDMARSSLSENECERATSVWRRKFSQAPTDAAERARQIRFLQQRGFSSRAIRAVLRGAEEPDS
jgi:regulatory protein